MGLPLLPRRELETLLCDGPSAHRTHPRGMVSRTSIPPAMVIGTHHRTRNRRRESARSNRDTPHTREGSRRAVTNFFYSCARGGSASRATPQGWCLVRPSRPRRCLVHTVALVTAGVSPPRRSVTPPHAMGFTPCGYELFLLLRAWRLRLARNPTGMVFGTPIPPAAVLGTHRRIRNRRRESAPSLCDPLTRWGSRRAVTNFFERGLRPRCTSTGMQAVGHRPQDSPGARRRRSTRSAP